MTIQQQAFGDKVFDTVRQAFRDGEFDVSLSETLIALVTKEDNPTKY